MELDTTKLKQAGFRKTVTHDNCVVLDIGSGSFPRYIEVRPPGDDGSRMTAIWDGSLELAVNDKVKCIEYGGNPVWAVSAMGGDDSAVGKVRVSKVWESDFGNIVMSVGATGLVVFQPAADSTTFLQVLDVDGGIPILNVDSVNERVGIGQAAPLDLLHISSVAEPAIRIQDTTTANSYFQIKDRTGTQVRLDKVSATSALIDINPLPGDGTSSASFRFFRATNTTGDVFFQILRGDGTGTTDAKISSANLDSYVSFPSGASFGIGTNLPTAAKAQIDQSSTILGLPVLLLDQADVDEPFTKHIGEAATGAGALTRSIVAEAEVTTATRIGWTKVEIDDVGNQVTDGDYFMPFYSLA